MFLFICTFFLLLNIDIYSARQSTPERFAILGAAVVGAELIYGAINLFKGDEGDEKERNNIDVKQGTNTIVNNKKNKEEQLKKLLAPSKLLDMVAETNQSQQETTKETNKRIESRIDPVPVYEKKTNKKNIKKKEKKKNVEPIKLPETKVYMITNYKTKEVYEYKKGVIDYYAVGTAYYNVGKKEKAKGFFLKTIALNINKEKSIKFLKRNYKMNDKEIMLQTAKYK